MMPKTLFISGSLCPKARHRQLVSATTGSCVVVEFDTLLDRSRYPAVSQWLSAADYTNDVTGPKLEKEAVDLLDFFLQDRVEDTTVPVGRAFRQSCMKVQAKQIVIPYLFNLFIAEDVFKRFEIDRIVVAPGSGVNVLAWKQVAREKGVPCDFLSLENLPGSLKRRFTKWVFRMRRRRAEKALAAQIRPATTVDAEAGTGALFIASERLQKRLKQELSASITPSPFSFVDAPSFPEKAGDELASRAAAYGLWWTGWIDKVFGPNAMDIEPTMTQSKDILLSLGEYFVKDVYPQQSFRWEMAYRTLLKQRPAVLLCDTQTDTPERMWSLAAAELGIPVVAYTYDHLIDPKLSFVPDYLLSDSGRNTKVATERGMESSRITETSSHRRPKGQPRKALELSSEPPLVLFGDSYYSGMNVQPDPQASCRYYTQLLATAAQLPNVQFKLKFHPLRGRKNERFSFTTMDDRELLVRTNYLRSLNPPANFSLIPPEENIQNYLSKAAILLNSNSIVALEAFHLGVPVVFVRKPDPTKTIFPCIDEYQADLCALNVEDLVKTIQNLLSDPTLVETQCARQRRYIDEYYWRDHTPILQALEKVPPVQQWLSNKSKASASMAVVGTLSADNLSPGA